MTTLRQIEANRKNSKKSTGPTSERGKEISSQNAVTHGLTAEKNLLDAMQDLIAERIEAFSATLQPETMLDRFLVEQAAVNSVRIEHAQLHQEAIRHEQSLRAHFAWDDDHACEAAERFEKIRKRPARTVRALLKTKHGCERLLKQWEFLARRLETGTAWNEREREMSLDLLGIDHEERGDRGLCPDAVNAQARFAQAEIARLKHRIDDLVSIDTLERHETIRGVGKPGHELKLMVRYENALRRTFDQAILLLTANRAGASDENPKATPKPLVIVPERTNPLEEARVDLDELLEGLSVSKPIVARREEEAAAVSKVVEIVQPAPTRAPARAQWPCREQPVKMNRKQRRAAKSEARRYAAV